MSKKVLYSNILQQFARPLLNPKDTDSDFMSKMKVIEMIWNFSIAKKYKMPLFDELERIITAQNKKFKEMEAVFDMFLELKETEYDQYNNYITNIELRKNEVGVKIFYVESVDVSELKLKNNMSKVGSIEKPAVVKVKPEELGSEPVEICNQKRWQVIAGVEPDADENISDIKKLEKRVGPVFKFQTTTSKNAPCPCGSSKQYKRCCGK